MMVFVVSNRLERQKSAWILDEFSVAMKKQPARLQHPGSELYLLWWAAPMMRNYNNPMSEWSVNLNLNIWAPKSNTTQFEMNLICMQWSVMCLLELEFDLRIIK